MAHTGTLAPVSRPAGLRDQIHERLRSAILTGELAPGTPVIEADLAARLGASRTPVREALRRLESEGLVVPRGARGSVVRNVPPDEARCIFEIRSALEALAARRAARRRDPAALNRIGEALASMSANVDDPVALERADTAFHDEIVAAAGGDRLTRMLTDIREETIAYRFLSLRDGARRRATVAEHTAIFKALRAGDADAAASAMAHHVENAAAVVAEQHA